MHFLSEAVLKTWISSYLLIQEELKNLYSDAVD